jgi:hypothetical protein
VCIITKGIFRRSLFLLRLIDKEGVRVLKCREGYKNAIYVRANGYEMLNERDRCKGKKK